MTRQNSPKTTARARADSLARHPHAADGSDYVLLAEMTATTTEAPDTRPTPSSVELKVDETLAYQERARRAAFEGWTLTAHQGGRPETRISYDLATDQPVLIGSTVAWATGVEVGDQYEVRLGTAYGPTLYVRSVLPCTEGNLQIRRAHTLTMELRMSLDACRDHTFVLEDQATLAALRDKVTRIESRLGRIINHW